MVPGRALLVSALSLILIFQGITFSSPRPAEAASEWTGTIETQLHYSWSEFDGTRTVDITRSADLSFTIPEDPYSFGDVTGSGSGFEEYNLHYVVSDGSGACPESYDSGSTDVTFELRGYVDEDTGTVILEMRNLNPYEFIVNRGCVGPYDSTGYYVYAFDSWNSGSFEVDLHDGAVYEQDIGAGRDGYDRITIHGSWTPDPDEPEEFDYEVYVQPEIIEIMQGEPVEFDLVATLFSGTPEEVFVEFYLMNDQGESAYIQAWDATVIPSETVPYEFPLECPGLLPGTYEIVVYYGTDFNEEPRSTGFTIIVNENPGCAPVAECHTLTITPTFPPESDPRKAARPSDTVSFRLQADWTGDVPTEVSFEVIEGGGGSITPEFKFNPANMLSSPISVLLDVTTSNTDLGEYPLTVQAAVFDFENPNEDCQVVTATTEVILVVTENFLPLIARVDNTQGHVIIFDDDGEAPAEDDQELGPGTGIETGEDGNVEILTDGGNQTTKIGRETEVEIIMIEPGEEDIEIIRPDWEGTEEQYPPPDDKKFWKDLFTDLAEYHLKNRKQLGKTFTACIIGKIPTQCYNEAIMLLKDGWLYLKNKPYEDAKVEPEPTKLLVTRNAAILPLGTEFSLQTTEVGTTLFVLEGSVLVMDLVSRNIVTVDANEQLTIPTTEEGLNEDQLANAITSIASGTYSWWTQPVKDQFQIADYGIGQSYEEEWPYEPVNRTTVFSDQDAMVYAWIKFVNMLPPDRTIDFKWYRPDGALYLNETRVVDIPASVVHEWSQLFIANTDAAGQPGAWKLKVYADGELIKETAFTILKSSNGGGECLIATAAFGSELTPQVQFLRNFRDSHILSTASGASFMTAFNAWYYSFSPYVADYEREQPWLQSTVKAAIYPLLGILQVSEKAYQAAPGEFGALSAGLIASAMIGAVYLSPVTLAIRKGRAFGPTVYKVSAILVAVASLAVVAAISVGNEVAMMMTTAMFVLTVLSAASLFVAKAFQVIRNKFRS